MAVQFSVPKGPDSHVWKCEYFKGVDLNNAASNASANVGAALSCKPLAV